MDHGHGTLGWRLWAAAWALAAWLGVGTSTADQSPHGATPEGPGHGEWLAVPTLGGKQFWADELFFRDWRIQQNVLDGHYRLVDPKNRRHGWGTFEQCRNRLAEIRRRQNLPPMQGTAVVVLHGLGRSRASMEKLCGRLRDDGFTVVGVTYPSTQRSVEEHARSLGRLVENLEGIERIHFVGHSLGNIVIRRFLYERIDPATGRVRDHRFGRMVMLAPPNHGSRLAEMLSENGLSGVVKSTPVQELGPDWAKLEATLATPPFPFGVIAGGKGDEQGYNPLLPGDDDGTVSVASTRLAGAADFTLVPVLHTFVMNDPAVIEQTVRFLKHGYFISPEARRPIEP